VRLKFASLSCVVALAVGAGGELPTEIRLFAAGVNQTEKGPYLFDAEAAKRVMAHYQARGVDVMIDLDHLSTDDTHPNYDGDARGWAKLELRNGELWAVGISWTPEGAQRVTNKTQRYVSPYFGWEETPDGQRRVVELVNFAICANPATHAAPALVAASKQARPSVSRAARRAPAVPVTSTLHLPLHLAARF
jgi:phage I-like protein